MRPSCGMSFEGLQHSWEQSPFEKKKLVSLYAFWNKVNDGITIAFCSRFLFSLPSQKTVENVGRLRFRSLRKKKLHKFPRCAYVNIYIYIHIYEMLVYVLVMCVLSFLCIHCDLSIYISLFIYILIYVLIYLFVHVSIHSYLSIWCIYSFTHTCYISIYSMILLYRSQ